MELRGVEGTPREGQRATCLVEPSLRQATLETAPIALAQTDLSVELGAPMTGGSTVPTRNLEDLLQLAHHSDISRVGGVSAAGKWAAGIPVDAREPTVYFVELSRVRR